MQIQGLSQERLKLIACITMLLDHVGATVVLECFYEATGESKAQLLQVYEVLRIVGRLAFPIYCFLLAEGAYHTHNPNRYALRLFVGAVLAEIPYDLALYGEIAWDHQSVMVTLLLGFLMLEVIKKTPRMVLKLLAIVPFALLADQFSTDYGSSGHFTYSIRCICWYCIWLGVMMDILFKTDEWVFSYRVAGICVQNGKVLLQKPTNDNAYAFPGGHVEFGETNEETLVREFKEEIGADIGVGELKWVAEIFFPWGDKPCHQICLYYMVEIMNPEIPKDGMFMATEYIEGRDFDLEYHWIPLEDVEKLEVYPTEIPALLRKLHEGVQHFVYKE